MNSAIWGRHFSGLSTEERTETCAANDSPIAPRELERLRGAATLVVDHACAAELKFGTTESESVGLNFS